VKGERIPLKEPEIKKEKPLPGRGGKARACRRAGTGGGRCGKQAGAQ